MDMDFKVKFDDKKIKSAVKREAEKAIAKKIAAQRPATPQKGETICKHCKTKFFVQIENGICPHCHKPLG